MAGEITQSLWTWKDRLGRFLRPHYPRVAVGLEAGHLLGVRLERDPREKEIVLEGYAQHTLPEGAWNVSFTRPNLRSPEDLRSPIGKTLEEVGAGGGSVSLLLPDSVARVSLLAFPELPIRRKEILPMIRFRLQKTVPFRMDEAILGFDILGRSEGGKVNLIAVILHRNVLRQYEEMFRGAGMQPGLVDLSSLNLLNLCRGPLGAEVPDRQDWLLVNFTEDFLTLLILRDEEIIFFRSKGRASLSWSDGLSSAGALRELRGSLSYYLERLGGQGIRKCLLRATTPVAEEFRRGLEEIAGVPAERLDPVPLLRIRSGLEPPDPPLLQRLLPLIGMALGRRE